jgi:Domain of unknown function (DUF4340)
MKLRDLSIAMVVLAALLGVLYWSNHRKQKEDISVKAGADAPPVILSLNLADITAIRIEHKDQPQVDLTREASGAWQISAPQPLPADQEAVAIVLGTLTSLTSERLLDEKATEIAGYGLANPPLAVDVTLKDNKTQKLLIGDQTPAGNSYYAMLSGNPRLYTVDTRTKSSLDKSANDLRDKRLLTADFDKVSQIELANPTRKQDITFARGKDAWQILKPQPSRADDLSVNELITALRGARFETAAADTSSKLTATFKSATPFATVKLSGASGTQELEIRKDKDQYLGKSSIVAGVYKLPATLSTSVDKSLEDFRDKRLFDFSAFQAPDKVEIHDGSKSYFLARSGSDWFGADGKKLDTTGALLLVNAVRALSADKFPGSGFSSPAIEITVTAQDGKYVEKTSIAKSGDAYVAKHNDEALLYGLPAAPVSDLEKAAAGLKPATEMPAPSKK